MYIAVTQDNILFTIVYIVSFLMQVAQHSIVLYYQQCHISFGLTHSVFKRCYTEILSNKFSWRGICVLMLYLMQRRSLLFGLSTE